MNILDFCFKGLSTDQYNVDLAGNVYIGDNLGRLWEAAGQLHFPDPHNHYYPYKISAKEYHKFGKIDIVLPVNLADMSTIRRVSDARRPYYRLRGKDITPEQAFDIISKTDSNFEMDYSESQLKGYLGCLNFTNDMLGVGSNAWSFGWVRPNGRIGLNFHMTKYPTIEEIVAELYTLLSTFPYLDFVIAITNWWEIPPDCEWDSAACEYVPSFPKEKWDEETLKSTVVGIQVKDAKITLYNKYDFKPIYEEYNKLYGEKFFRELEWSYNNDRKIKLCDEDYIAKCKAIYNLK